MTCLQCKNSKIKPKITCHGSEASIAFNCGCKFDVKVDGGPVKVITKHANLGNAQSIEWRTHNCLPCKQKESAWQTLETGCKPPLPPAGQLIKQECAGSSLKQYFTDGKGGQTVTTIPFVVNFTATVSGGDVDLAWAGIDGASYVLKRNGQPIPITGKDAGLANGTYTYTLDVTTMQGCKFTETTTATIDKPPAPTAPDAPTMSPTVINCNKLFFNIDFVDGLTYILKFDGQSIDPYSGWLEDVANGNHTISLQAYKTESPDLLSAITTKTVTVNKPTLNLSGTSTCNQVTFHWSAIAGADYELSENYQIRYHGSETSFTIYNVSPGTHSYMVSATVGDCTVLANCTVNVAEIPTATNSTLTATVTGCNNVVLAWTAIANTKFTLFRDDTQIYFGYDKSFSDNNKADGTYVYRLKISLEWQDQPCFTELYKTVIVSKPTVSLSASVSCKNVTLTATFISGATYTFKKGTTVLATSASSVYTDGGLANGNYGYSVVATIGTCVISATASASINVPAYGTLISTGACVGSYRTKIYHDGNCGQYSSQVQDCAGCCPPSGTIISTSGCSGSYRTRTYANGCCGSYTGQIQDCAGCCPPSGTFTRSECIGTTKRSYYTDGCCGETYSDAVNSTDCGYVAPQVYNISCGQCVTSATHSVSHSDTVTCTIPVTRTVIAVSVVINLSSSISNCANNKCKSIGYVAYGITSWTQSGTTLTVTQSWSHNNKGGCVASGKMFIKTITA